MTLRAASFDHEWSWKLPAETTGGPTGGPNTFRCSMIQAASTGLVMYVTALSAVHCHVVEGTLIVMRDPDLIGSAARKFSITRIFLRTRRLGDAWESFTKT